MQRLTTAEKKMMKMIPITRIEWFLNGIVNGGSVPEPINRIEIMLNNIINRDVVSLEPISRFETYLAKISGADVTIPKPITRVDKYLARIAGEDVEVPDTYYSRLEYWLNLWRIKHENDH